MAFPGTVRRQLNSLTRNVLNEVRRTIPEGSGESHVSEVVSSLPLQMSLYFNALYFPFWWISDALMLQIKVPELAGFLLLSLLLQLPLLLFLLFDSGLLLLPMEMATHGILTGFLIFEIPLAFFTLRRTTRLLAGRFHQLGSSKVQA